MTFTHRLFAPGWYRACSGHRPWVRLRHGHRRAGARALRLGPDPRLGRDHHGRRADRRAARLPGRDRLLRLLVPLGLGRPDDPRGPLGPRRVQLARLLPGEHRSQGDRHPVHLHHLLLLHRRRPDGDADARGARPARHAVRGSEHLQRAVLGARLADDLPVHHPGVRRDRELRDPADDRRAGHGVPAPERALLLDAAGGGRDDAGVLLRRGRRLRHGLDRLRARCRPRRRWASSSSRSACSSRAPRRSRPRSTSWSRSSRCARRA